MFYWFVFQDGCAMQRRHMAHTSYPTSARRAHHSRWWERWWKITSLQASTALRLRCITLQSCPALTKSWRPHEQTSTMIYTRLGMLIVWLRPVSKGTWKCFFCFFSITLVESPTLCMKAAVHCRLPRCLKSFLATGVSAGQKGNMSEVVMCVHACSRCSWSWWIVQHPILV